MVLLGGGNIGVVLTQLAFRSILIATLVPASYGRLSLILSVYNTVWIIGTTGLPSSVARYIAIIAPADDSAIIRSALRAGIWPTAVAATVTAVVSAILLGSPLAFVFAIVGLSSLVYSLIAMGILRGRGRMGSVAVMTPIAGIGEVTLLAALWLSGLGVTELSAFGVFCIGNVIGLGAGIFYTLRTDPKRASNYVAPTHDELAAVPTSRQLLGFSMWLGAATVGIAALPLIVRFAAALDSYTVVAIVDVALVLLTVPQRMGAVVVSAVIPHAARTLKRGDATTTISRQEHLIVIAPFVLAAIGVAFTPVVGWLFDLLGRPEYAKSAQYLALALLAGPARVLYGLVEGVLVAHGEGRFLAFNSLSITAVAAVAILAAAALGSMVVAFAIFVVACWAVYLCGLRRIDQLSSIRAPAPAEG
jgi:O-antigen/teichoic acid export membrane protein